LKSSQQHCRIEFAGAQHVNPGLVLELLFVGHLQDASAEVVHAVSKLPSERPAFEVIVLYGIVPSVAFGDIVALENVKQFDLSGHSIAPKKVQIIDGRAQAILEGAIPISRLQERASGYIQR